MGHKGAAHIEPGNTLASFDAALRHDVDMIELDVLSEHRDGSGALLVAHDYEDMHSRVPLSLQEALEHLAGPAFAGIELDVDIKLPGYERRVLDALREFELVPRTLISGMFPEGLDLIRRLEPGVRLGWSVPRVRRDYTTDMLTAVPALAVLTGYRALLPRRARRALSEGRFDAIMAHWRVVTPALVRAVAEGGGQLYVWTVDDARLIAKLTSHGGRRDHHQRPPPVRAGLSYRSQRAALNPAGSAPASTLRPAVVGRVVRASWRVPPRIQRKVTVPRRVNLPRELGGFSVKLQPPWRAPEPEPTSTQPLLLDGSTAHWLTASMYSSPNSMYILSAVLPSPGIDPRIPTVLGWSGALQMSIVAHSSRERRSWWTLGEPACGEVGAADAPPAPTHTATIAPAAARQAMPSATGAGASRARARSLQTAAMP